MLNELLPILCDPYMPPKSFQNITELKPKTFKTSSSSAFCNLYVSKRVGQNRSLLNSSEIDSDNRSISINVKQRIHLVLLEEEEEGGSLTS